jgi:hypothetical protein
MRTMSQRFTPHSEVTGVGDPIVFVRGGWTHGSRWDAPCHTGLRSGRWREGRHARIGRMLPTPSSEVAR